MSVERENAVINNTIILRTNFRYSQTGDFFNPSAISKVEILDSNGVTVLQTITGVGIIHDATGKYHVVASAVSSAKTIYDKWYFTPSTGADEITDTSTCQVWATSAGSSGYLTTLDNLKLALDLTNDADDTLLEEIILRESKFMESYCGRVFKQDNYTEYHDGEGESSLFTEQYPIISVTSIHDDTLRVFGAGTEIASSYIIVREDIGLVRLDGTTFQSGMDNVKVVYSAGYATIPEDLESACIKLSMADYIEQKGGINAIEGETVVYKPFNLRKEATKTLDLYRSLLRK